MPAIIRITIDGVDSTGAAFQGAQRGLRDLDDAARKSGSGFNAFKEVAIGALRQVGVIAVEVGMAAAGAMANFVRDSVSAAGDFEAGINSLNAVAGSSLADYGYTLDDVSKKALQLGKDTQYSAKEALDAMTELVKGGVAIESVMTDATDATLALAAAGGVELAKAGEIVSKVLGVWTANGVTATSATDAIAAAANASSLDVEGFAGAMYNAQGRAAAMDMDFRDFAATIAMISPNFKSGETAGVSYNNFLSSLIPKTNKATDAMKDLGLVTEEGKNQFFDATGAFIGNRAAAQLLQDSFAGLSAEQALTFKNIIFGNDAMGAANMLIEKGAAGYDAAALAMDKAGTAADVAKTKQEGFAHAMNQLSGSVDTLKIMLGTKLLPILTPIIGKFTDLVNIGLAFAEGSYFTAITSLGSWLAENVNPALGSFVANLAIATDPLQALKDGILTFLIDVANALPGKLIEWASAFGAWVWDAMPILLSNLGTLATNFLAWAAMAGDEFKAALAKWAEHLGQWAVDALGIAATVASTIQANITPILAAVGAMVFAVVIPAFAAWAAAAWTTAAANLAALAPILIPIALIGAAAALLAVMWEQNWFGIRDTLTAFWTGTGEPIFTQLTTWLAATLTTAIQSLTDFWTNTLLPALQSVWAFIQDPLMPLFAAIGNVLTAVVGVAVSALAALWSTTLKPALSGVWAMIKNYLQPVLENIAGVLGRTVGPAVAKLGGFFDTAKTAAGGFKGMIDGVISFLNRLADTIRKIPTPKWPSPPSWLGGGGSGGGGGARVGGGFAKGVTNFAGGLALVGEEGPELVRLPRGSDVIPNSRSVTNNFNYSPSYGSAPASPALDFSLMQTRAAA